MRWLSERHEGARLKTDQIYWIGPSLGALLAAGFFKFVKMLEYELANPGQDSDREKHRQNTVLYSRNDASPADRLQTPGYRTDMPLEVHV